ncbi:MAG: hypothetical protein ACREML_09620 [Vulcanimicrobiaceae bacterium]
MQTTERRAAEDLAKRIEGKLIDSTEIDESHQAPGDRSPGYADVLMNETPLSVERAAELSSADWQLIASALEHYAACGKG